MKKVSPKQKHRFKLLLVKRNARHLKKLRLARRKKELFKLKVLRGKEEYRNQICIELPVIINVNVRKFLIKKIKKIRDLYFRRKIHLVLSFKNTKRMYAEGTLYLLAELDTLKFINKDIKITIIKSKELIVNQVLHQTGLLDLLNQSMTFDEEFDESVKYWKPASGFNSEIDDAEYILEYFDSILPQNTNRALYTVLTEAITNSSQHAYLENRFVRVPKNYKKWWLFSQVKNNYLSVCVCDLGIGIPRSLEVEGDNVREDWLGRFHNFIKMNKLKFDPDSAAIKAAIEISNTRTKLPNRGKGLNQIINQINSLCANKASVAIYSNKGSYLLNHRENAAVQAIGRSFKESIHGTIITWNIPLSS